MKMFLGAVMHEARIRAGITLRELALKVGCAPSLLSEVENGLRPAPKDEHFLEKLAAALDLEAKKVKEAANNDRARRDMRFFKDVFARDDELAACYCRAKEVCNEDELKKLLKEAFSRAADNGKGESDESSTCCSTHEKLCH